MKAVGVIAEYNPFHNGHLRHIRAAKELSGQSKAVAVMSGGFVQRGEPCVIPKTSRVKTALEQGADVVLEIPVFYSAAAADYFARAAVKILEATGTVDSICFGSECGDISALAAAAAVLLREPDTYKRRLKESLAGGVSYAEARGGALSSELGHLQKEMFAGANNNLGMEYIKALAQINSPMKVFTVKRLQGEDLVSASFIRSLMLSGKSDEVSKYLPYEITEDFQNPRSLDDYSEFFKTFLYRAKHLYKYNLAGELESCLNTPDMAEGLENRFLNKIPPHEKLTEALSFVKTKRYALTRLQRTALHLILGITKGDIAALEAAGGPQYIRLLGFRKESEGLVKEIARNASLPFIADAAGAKKALSPFALKVFERELQIDPPVPVVKVT